MLRCVLVLVVVASWAPAARGNIAAFEQGGATVAGPVGVDSCDVLEATLKADLAPVAHSGRAPVTVTYSIRCSGAARTVPLVFYTGSAMTDLKVSLDDQALPVVQGQGGVRPEWLAGRKVPPLSASDVTHTLAPRELQTGRFDAILGPGVHTLVVSYAAHLVTLRTIPLQTWVFAYALVPARDWRRFGTLNVDISYPAGWKVATSPAIPLEGGRLAGRLPGLVVDHLMVSLRAPVTTGFVVFRWVLWGLLAAFLLAPLWSAFSRGRGGHRFRWRGPAWALGGAVGFAVIAVIDLAWSHHWFLPEGQATPPVHGLFLLVVVPVLASAVGLTSGVAQFMAHRLGRRRA